MLFRFRYSSRNSNGDCSGGVCSANKIYCIFLSLLAFTALRVTLSRSNMTTSTKMQVFSSSFYLSFSFLAVQDKRGKKNERKEEKTSLGPIFFFFSERKRKCITWNAAFNSYTWNTMTFFCFCVTMMIRWSGRQLVGVLYFFIFFRICFMTRHVQTTEIPMVYYRTKVSLVFLFYPWIFSVSMVSRENV